jgi:hypothetical protein
LTTVSDLSEIDVDEVSPVRSGAIRKRWALLKADEDGAVELSKEVVDALSTPLDDEAAFVEKLQKDGYDEPAREARVVIARLTKAFYGGAEHSPAELDAIARATVPELQAAGEDNDDIAEDEEFLPQPAITKAGTLAAEILKSLEAVL